MNTKHDVRVLLDGIFIGCGSVAILSTLVYGKTYSMGSWIATAVVATIVIIAHVQE